MRRRLWRRILKLRYLAFQHHRTRRPVLETFEGLPLLVVPGVFHPSLFRTSRVFFRFLDNGLAEGGILDLLGHPGARALEIGTGSGILAIRLAMSCTDVVAADISEAAVRCSRANALLNEVDEHMEVRLGDLFTPVLGERFDVILFNFPYFNQNPTSSTERAFFSTELKHRFADGLPRHLKENGKAFVLLSSDGDEVSILETFSGAGLEAVAVHRVNLISEIVTIYRLSPLTQTSSRK